MLAIRQNSKSTGWSAVAIKTLLGLSVASASLGEVRLQADEPFDEAPVAAYLQSAQFKIPFNVEARGNAALQVQLWVSTDDGASWQPHGKLTPDAKYFEFRAAAEGVYLFKVESIDATGVSFPSAAPPLKVLVDTTKPHAELKADVDATGQLVVDVRVADEYLDVESAELRVRSDHESQWRELPLSLTRSGEFFAGQANLDLAPCREIALVFTVKDRAQNLGEATLQYSVPRTAAAESDMTLASTRQPSKVATARPPSSPSPATPWADGVALPSTPGATRWNPTTVLPSQPAGSNFPTVPLQSAPPGKLVAQGSLSLDAPAEVQVEELPPPPALEREYPIATDADSPPPTTPPPTDELQLSDEPQGADSLSPQQKVVETESSSVATETTTIGAAYHCKSRTFSLDYSVQALGGSALADVELWGTEDGGRTWQKWGSDPDRVSPFDVQVGNDGLFGFRMVIVGVNGVVSNRPREGDAADVWINVDTARPNIKITRAVYGEGPEDGLLVIDYTCEDGHLAERPINLFYSERVDGPWETVASGLANTGLYLWKVAPSLPNKIFLKVEAIDKAGNLGAHRLDLPIDVRGLIPRGIIQGFRPIEMPN